MSDEVGGLYLDKQTNRLFVVTAKREDGLYDISYITGGTFNYQISPHGLADGERFVRIRL